MTRRFEKTVTIGEFLELMTRPSYYLFWETDAACYKILVDNDETIYMSPNMVEMTGEEWTHFVVAVELNDSSRRLP